MRGIGEQVVTAFYDFVGLSAACYLSDIPTY